MRVRDAVRAVLFSTALTLAAPFGAAMATPLDFDFSYTGTGITASGEFITDGVLTSGHYTVTGITGTRNGVAITGLVSFLGSDNLLFPTAPFVDDLGISYAAGGIDTNLYDSTVSMAGCTGVVDLTSTNSSTPCLTNIQVSLTVTPASTAVPEPASLALLGTALAGLGVIRRRRKRAA